MSKRRQELDMKSSSGPLERHLNDVSERISPLVDTSSIEGFGLRLHGNILGIENYAYQTNRVTNEEQKKNMQKSLKII